ncbi:MAG: efflux RND transporter periplasmic adaptor subunit [Hyphomicrobiaceae bacterium]
MTKSSRALMTILASLAILGGVYYFMQRPATVVQSKGGRWAATDGPVPVRVAHALAADVPVYFDAVGAARALNTVSVQPQVGGKILEIGYREGQTVQKGQVLARIDPATYQATLDQTKAKLAQDESQLANARLDLERYAKIPGAIPVKTVDTQRALVAQLTGQAASSKAAVDAAQLQLSYTQIVAPLTGRTGIRQVDEGNIVAGSGGQAIVTITQVQPISVIFNLPQQQLAQVNRAAAAGLVKVEAMEADNKTSIDSGQLQVVDNQVDQTTGTVRMKAEFPNSSLQLWPGQFVNVRLLIETLPQAVTVPTAAIQRGPTGTFVYIAGTDNKVAARPVTVPQQDDVRAVVASGVQAGDKVVTSGFARLKEGTEVAVATTEELNATPVAPKRESTKGQGKRKRDGAAPADGQTPAATPGGEGKGKGEGRRKRQDATPSADAPAPAAPAPTSDANPTFRGQVGQKTDQKAPEAAAQ